MSSLPARLSRAIQANPMIRKELRGRMRSGRTAILLTVYLLLLVGFAILVYGVTYETTSFGGGYNQQVGRGLLDSIVVFETLLVMFLAPALTAAGIAGERERQTFDLLMTTLLKPRSIILGKLGSALAFLLLLILAVLPLQSIAFMIGGVAPEEIAGSVVVLFCTALLYGSIGIFWSSMMKSTATATVLSYGTLLAILAGLPFLLIVVGLLSSNPGGISFTAQHPVVSLYATGFVISSDPITAMGVSQQFLSAGKSLFFYTDSGIINGRTIFVIQPWFACCLLSLLGSALFLAVAVRILPPVRRTWPTQPVGYPVAAPQAGSVEASPPAVVAPAYSAPPIVIASADAAPPTVIAPADEEEF
ncbi:MAG: ABC transporter permease subunit [Chloroflexia bacterium]